MKRFRATAIGLSVALAGTSARAADWRAGGSSAPAAPAVWWPVGAPPPVARAAPPDLVPSVQPVVPIEATVNAGPRGTGAPGALPLIPVVPDVPPARVVPPLPQQMPELREPPRARSDEQPPPRPMPPDGALAQPRPTPQQPELPPAPPEFMIPPSGLGVSKRGTFGSPPLTISRDWPTLREVHSGVGIDEGGFGAREAGAFQRFFVSGEYLLWWMPGFPTPVLGTTNANTARNGFLGEPGTTSLLGPGPFLDSTRQGFRVRAGAWWEEAGCGIDAGFFFLGNRSRDVAFDPDQFPLITRPIFAPNPMPNGQPVGESGEAVSVPGVLRGTLSARGESRLWGIDANLRQCWFAACDERAEWFVGYRHLNLRERLTISEDITVIGDGTARGIAVTDPVGTRVFVQDDFQTRNSFHGAQFGMRYERRFGAWDFDARASVALGTTYQALTIRGFQARQQPTGAPMFFRNGGLLAAQTNIGRFTRDRFSVVPELTLSAGYWVTPSVRVFAGYNLLMWTNVIRPGDQIDRVVDVTFVPNGPMMAVPSGMNRPRPTLTQRDLVVNGVQFGVDWRW
jgi:Putative beta barrel porin-7 (BBP7)